MQRFQTVRLIVITLFILGMVAGVRAQGKAQELCDQGKKFMEAGQYLQAAEAYKQAIRLQPTLEEANSRLKDAYGRLGYGQQIDEAHRLLRDLAPNDAVGHYALGLLYLQKGDMGYAQEEYEILQKLNPGLAKRLDHEYFEKIDHPRTER